MKKSDRLEQEYRAARAEADAAEAAAWAVAAYLKWQDQLKEEENYAAYDDWKLYRDKRKEEEEDV